MNHTKRISLIKSLIKRPESHNIKLQELKYEASQISQRQDWLWHLLLSSMSTMDNSRGYDGLINNPDNYSLVSYQTLQNLTPENRLINLQQALRYATVRRYRFKSEWLYKNFKFIESCGSLATIQKFILQTSGRESKLRLMKLFYGIGDKYARNIFMDLYHEDFINSVAIDGRLLDVSNELEIDSQKISYLEHEELFVAIASESNLTPWSMDRLLYNFNKYYINAMNNDA
jgi:hypothetical protein